MGNRSAIDRTISVTLKLFHLIFWEVTRKISALVLPCSETFCTASLKRCKTLQMYRKNKGTRTLKLAATQTCSPLPNSQCCSATIIRQQSHTSSRKSQAQVHTIWPQRFAKPGRLPLHACQKCMRVMPQVLLLTHEPHACHVIHTAFERSPFIEHHATCNIRLFRIPAHPFRFISAASRTIVLKHSHPHASFQQFSYKKQRPVKAITAQSSATAAAAAADASADFSNSHNRIDFSNSSNSSSSS